MVPWALVLCSLPLSVLAASPKTLGVSPDLLDKYVPIKKTNTWKCLDGSKEIPWDFVNDDSCDCSDGSDEPGTSACPDNKFYCANEGHIGAFIASSRVNDGLCEVQCCDGSDERSGVCPNLCKEIGEAYRKKRDAELKIQRTASGAKIRSTYIAFAHQEKKRLQAEVEKLAEEIKVKEKEVDRLHDIFERTESLSQVALEYKKESSLYKSLLAHHKSLKSLQIEHKKHLEREKALGDILDALRTGYNPNYQDMAVLEAVRGWEELAHLPHINDVGKDTEASEEAETEEEKKDEGDEPLGEGLWTPNELEFQVEPLLYTDYVSLLLEYEDHINTPHEGSILFELTNYLPDSVLPVYEEIKDTLVSWLQKVNIIRKDDSAAEATKAQQAYNDAKNDLESKKSELVKKEGDVKEIFNIHGFGAKGEWKKLDGTCLEKDTGDYTYEVCLFKEVKQKPNNGGTTFSLGKFKSWNPSPDVQPGTPEYYQTQVYHKGTRCWNGPERNVLLRLTCGVENAILTVQELEKCEYEITGTSPALCLPVDGDNNKKNGSGKKDEL